MVPPIYPGNDVLITRVGEQRTYVFFKDGVETFIIKPGFSGKVDEFGMLIPFPTPPAVRKVPDDIFEQITAAIDPPEVVVDLRPRVLFFGRAGAPGPTGGGFGDRLGLKFDDVRVLRQEAVGMYEVTTLEAGSAAALKRWMDDHGYQYPTGMDKACDEYVAQGWCFVAVKTKVGQKKGVDPRPGQREVNPKLPAGATFDGHVQAMGFRFKTKEFSVPMRLSSFNAGQLHNIVYLLTDGPRRIRGIGETLVVRQLDGQTLYANLTQPLPLRVIGGQPKDIPAFRRQTLPQERDPAPHNGLAKELFASDLLAVSSGELGFAHEEKEKELLRVGERLGLRGPEIDKLNADVLKAERAKIVARALDDVRRMTLTVVDGDFPRDVLAKDNLKFAEFRMPQSKNSPDVYDAKEKGPAAKKEGVRVGSLSASRPARIAAKGDAGPGPSPPAQAGPIWRRWEFLGAAGLMGLIGLAWLLKRPSSRAMLLVAALAVVIAAGSSAAAQQNQTNEKAPPTVDQLLDQLSKNEKAEEAVEALVKLGAPAVKELYGEAVEGKDMTRRGWAIVALSEIGGEEVDKLLTDIHADTKQSTLVRTWAAAGRVRMAKSTDELIKLAELVGPLPALGRPVGLRLVEKLAAAEGGAKAEDMLRVTVRVPQLQQGLAPAILAMGAEKLVDVMVHGSDQQVRYQAAAYVGTLASKGDKEVGRRIADAYRFDPKAEKVPWTGGPLYVPGINWNDDKENAKALVRNLVAWHLFCDRHNLASEQRQINNNLQSITLAQVVGYQFGGDGTTAGWLRLMREPLGKEEIEKMLKEQGEEENEKYKGALP
jgi:hypothetical protein